MTHTTDKKQDRNALLLFVILTVAFCAGAYVPILTGGGFEALGGYAVLLLMWSPGCAGIVTSLVLYRSLTPLGLAGNRRTLYWIVACMAAPIVYALIIKWGLATTGMISLGKTDLPITFLIFTGLLLSLRNALGEELGWRGFAAPVVTRVFGYWPGQTLLGIFWFLFHVPALLGTSYGSSPHPWLGNFVFVVSCMALRMWSGITPRFAPRSWDARLGARRAV